MKLDDHLEALRAIDGDDSELAGVTRLRVRRSLERGHGMRRHSALIAALAVLFVASASWALATKVWRTEPVRVVPTPAPVVAPPVAPPLKVVPSQVAPVVEAPRVVVTPPIEVTPPPVVIAPPVVGKATPKPIVVPKTEPVSPLYRHAHELYFHDHDYTAALAAWDAYLAAEPSGQFTVEARYNRALCLVHLDRMTEARDALLPFANGEVTPAGYRQDEAKQLETKIETRLNGKP